MVAPDCCWYVLLWPCLQVVLHTESLTLFWFCRAAVVASFFILHFNLTLITPSAAALCLGIVAGIGASIAGAILPPACTKHPSLQA